MTPIHTIAKGPAPTWALTKSLTLGLTFGLALASLAAPASANDSQFYGAKDMDVWATPPGPEVVVHNTAANHHIDSLHLAIQGNAIAVGVSGYVDCTGVQVETLSLREGHYLAAGAYGIGRTSLLMSQALPNSNSIDHISAMGAHNFQMPVALLANAQINVDPVAVVLAAADKAPDKLQWLRQNHTLTVKIPLRWEAQCNFYTRNKITKNMVVESSDFSYLTKDVELKIKYEGDPKLFAVNAQIAQGGMKNQIQVGDQPFKITSMTFQPNMPHHVGACPATTKIRVFYQGQGKGEIRIRINDGGTTIHNSPKIAFDSKNGKQHYDFEIATPKPANSDLNKTVMHNLRVFYRGKADSEQIWPTTYQLMNTALWKHRCTPQLNPALGGGIGGIQQKAPQPKPVRPLRQTN